MFLKLSLLLLIAVKNPIAAQSVANMIIEKNYPCKDVRVPNEKINFTLVPKTFTSPQVLDIIFAMSVPLGNQIRMSLNIDLENKHLNKYWQHLFTIEDDFCRFVQLYMGPLMYDLETAMGLPKGVCPFPKGNYHAVNFTADFNRMKLQTLPFGKMRATLKFYEKPEHTLVMCKMSILSNTR